MFQKIILWISVVTSIAGIILIIIEKLGKESTNLLTSSTMCSLIVLGTFVAILLAVTENSFSTAEPGNVKNVNNNQSLQINIYHLENNCIWPYLYFRRVLAPISFFNNPLKTKI